MWVKWLVVCWFAYSGLVLVARAGKPGGYDSLTAVFGVALNAALIVLVLLFWGAS